MASLNNTSIEPLMISSENVENGVSKRPTKIKWRVQNWKNIVTWCYISNTFIIVLVTSIMVLIMYSKSETIGSHLEDNQIANQNNLNMFNQVNATLFNIVRSLTKLERKIDNNSRKVNETFTEIGSKMKIIENKSVEIASDLSEFKSSQTLFEEEVQDKYDLIDQSLNKLKNESFEIASVVSTRLFVLK